MKRKPMWILAAIVAGLLASTLLWNYSMEAAARQGQDRAAQRGIAAQTSDKDFFDIRDKKSKDAISKLDRRLEKFSSTLKAKNGAIRQAMGNAGLKKAGSVPGLQTSFSDLTNSPEIFEIRGKGNKFLTPSSKQPRESVAKGFINDNVDLFGLSPKQVASLRKTADYTNSNGKLSWLKMEQQLNGMKVFQGQMTAAFTSDGELARMVSNLAGGIDEADLKTSVSVSAAAAVVSAASSFGVTLSEGDLIVKEASPDGRTVIFQPVGPISDDIKVELMYFPLRPGLATLAWSMVLWQDQPAYYMLVDAEEGGVLWRKNIVNYQTQTATFSVYNDDSPAPHSPTTALPGSGFQAPAIGRSLITLISELPAFDNLGWITDGINTTTGNNVDAGLDIVSPNGIDPDGRAVGSPDRVFDFPYNPSPGNPPPADAPTLASYRMGAVTQLFFWTNRYHDRLYELGFTEAAGNFQQDNFGRGGLGNDRVLAEAQDFSGTNNANFGTPPDGSSGRMQMYIFTGPTPDRDGDLDQEIVIHELTHGTSNRLHGNGSGLNSNVAGGMGEGWGDFYGRALLSTADEDVNGLYASGAYATLQLGPLGTDNYYYGIRRFPYAVKTTVGANGKPHNPLTFADTDPAQIDTTDGAFPESPLGFSFNGANEVHNLGEIWCMTLLEARARIITRLGWAVGNQRALQIVTDGMKLDPLNPNMLQARDSILTADCAGFGGEDELDIWAGFAARGMGFSAKYNTATAVTEAFDLPNLTVGAVTVSNDTCSPPDGFADPGETVTLNIPLTNPFCSTSINGVTVSVEGGPSISYGDIPAGGTASQPFSFTVPAEAACGSQLPVTVAITDSVGTVTRTFNLQIGRPVVLPSGNYSASNIPIPDLNFVEIPFNVTEIGAVGDINVKIRLDHTWDGDLQISLIGPDGTSVPLATNRGDSGDNYGTGPNDCSGVPTVFDDSATTPIGVGVAPFDGAFKPESPLAAFNGKPTNGLWKLRFADIGPADIGTVGCATLEITRVRFSCCGVPGAVIQAAPPIAVVSESCLPGNGAPDPDETVTVSFPMVNLGVANATNLVATLLPGGGILAPSGPQSYGLLVPDAPPVARPFTFTVAGMCGGDLAATFALQDGATSLGTVTFPVRIGATLSSSASFSNTTPILIPGTGTGSNAGAPASPYPSTIEVSGVTGTVSKVTVDLFNFNYSIFPDDADILLVGPGGQKILLMSDVGEGTTVVNANLTFDDGAPGFMGAVVVSGTFKPTNVDQGLPDLFPAPAPAGPYPDPQLLSAFNGIDPNGTWSLYAVDDFSGFVGNINGGWRLNITTSDPVCCTSACALSVPANITVNSDPGVCGAVVNYPAPTFTGLCGVVTSDPPSGSLFPIGTTTVRVTGTRQDGTVTASSFTVTVNPPVFGSVTGGGTVSQGGVNSNFGFNVRYKRCGPTLGEFEFTKHRSHGGDIELKSAFMESLVITGDKAVFTGKAKLNGARNYTFTVTVVDKSEPGRNDKFGLQVKAPDGTVVSDLTFAPLTLRGGNIQIHSPDCDHDHEGSCRGGH